MSATESTGPWGPVELHGPLPETDYYGYYRKDWIDLCEDLKGNDRTVYGVLRSLVFENRGRRIRNDVRVNLSLNDLCALIPGAGGKPITLGGLRDSLRRLTRVGLISDPEGNPLSTSSREKAAAKPLRIRIHDTPCNDYVPRWRNTEEKLAAIKAGWKSNPEDDAGWKSNPLGWKSNPLGQESNPDAEPEQAERDLYTSSVAPDLSTSSPVSTASAAPAVVTEQEAEEEISTDNSDNATTAVDMIGRLPGKVTRLQSQRLAEQAAGLVTAGWGIGVLERELSADLGGVQSHYAVYKRRMTDLAKLAPVADKAAEVGKAPTAPRFDVELAALWEDAASAARTIAEPGTRQLVSIELWIKRATKAELTAFIASPSLDVLERTSEQTAPRVAKAQAAFAAVADAISA